MYNEIMITFPQAIEVLFFDTLTRDRTSARRAALTDILLQEGYLTREQLIARVEGKLGKGCFGESAWEDNFFRDMQVVKRALRAANFQPAYSRVFHQPGYYLRGQPPISPGLMAILGGSVREVDLAQIAIFKQLTFQQRFQQGCSISNLANRTVAYRKRLRNPEANQLEIHRAEVKPTSHDEL